MLEVLKANGALGRYVGDSALMIDHAAPMDKANVGSLCFYRGMDPACLDGLVSDANLFIVREEAFGKGVPQGNYVVTTDPDLVYCVIAGLLEIRPSPRIDDRAVIGAGAVVGQRVTVGAFAVLGAEVVIEDDVFIGEGCVVRHASVGKATQIGPGAKVGYVGFGCVRDRQGHWHERPHFGRVSIGAYCHIREDVAISRGTLGDTNVGSGVRIGPHSVVGHGVSIGDDCFLAQAVKLAGSVSIGRSATLWSGAVVRDGVRIGENAVVGMGAVVLRDVPAGNTVVGNPARSR